ncbi:MAG: aminotransferase class V-fold PLP-dependent enzyme [Proteobacteria bacterium]|nr:aminotransferase class V-fold PLP-dependent enzyme [Pseudomonadota bacterium]MBI3497424.1 aminotransferase class V-fold PLP-dependent enzyme [Pseudomonadota bacterium]
MPGLTRSDCEALDAADPLAALSRRFAAGEAGTLYFDANSVGAMPVDAPARVDRILEEWRNLRRRGWSSSTWLDAPRRLGAKLAPLIGAAPDEVVVCDTTSINLFKALSAALALKPGRRRIVSQVGTFPTDLYVVQGLQTLLAGLDLHLVPDGAAIEPALTDTTAVLYLSQVDYRTARRLDIRGLTAAAHGKGILTVWDLSHGAGAVPAELDAAAADFAVGCGYKYLCGGPGAPAYLFVARRHQEAVRPALAGWMGHADPFRFSTDYAPGEGPNRFLVGTPSVIANAVMEAALDIWAKADPALMFAKHAQLGDLLIRLAREGQGEAAIEVASPVSPDERGGFVALRHNSGGAVVGALADAGVVASFRPPDSIRFGLSALYHRYVDIWDVMQRLHGILSEGSWRAAKYAKAKTI